jgi:hypothetical protein
MVGGGSTLSVTYVGKRCKRDKMGWPAVAQLQPQAGGRALQQQRGWDVSMIMWWWWFLGGGADALWWLPQP